jgi:predicted DNA-binding protein YlxM (UPF0122 family)
VPYTFRYDRKLGISVPDLQRYWEDFSLAEQAEILKQWEEHRSDIPARIKEIEREIEKKQTALSTEEDFAASCRINDDITELANIIHQLNIWYGIQQQQTCTSS